MKDIASRFSGEDMEGFLKDGDSRKEWVRGWGWPVLVAALALALTIPAILVDGCCSLTTQHLPLN